MPIELAHDFNVCAAIMTRFITPLLQWDHKGFLWFVNLAASLNIIHPAKIFSRLGDGYLYLVLGLAIFWFDKVDGESFLYLTLMAFAIELPLYLLLKNTIRRPRPTESILGFKASHKPSDKFSLPSGHTAAAFVFATMLSWHYPEIMGLAFSIAGMIGLSRVLLGVHYPSDIAAGILLGCTSALIVLPI